MKKILHFIFGGKCQCGNSTHEKNGAGDYECFICKGKKSLQKKMDAEKTYSCPKDGKNMTKEVIFGTIINRCPKCQGVWLDNGRLEHLREIFGDITRGTEIL